MRQKSIIPITAITVFGASSLLATAVAIVLYLGLSQAARTTQQLWAGQSRTLIDAMEESLDSQLEPIREQARWVAKDIHDLSDLASLDEYIYGAIDELSIETMCFSFSTFFASGRCRGLLR